MARNGTDIAGEDCPSAPVLRKWADGSLSGPERDEIESHLADCPRCVATTETFVPSGEATEAPGKADSGDGSFVVKVPRRGDSAGASDVDNAPTTRDSTASELQDMRPGDRLGPYRIVRKLGQGGMGAVYEAVHEHLAKNVAIKVLPHSLTHSQDAIGRFRREMKAVGQLNHPNIVQAFDAGEIAGTQYLAMEYIDGQDLTQVVASRGTLSVANACKVVRQSAAALAAAHAAGLVHRDLKPSNLLLTRSGQVKLLDLGLALLGDDGQTAGHLTTAGQSFGTPDYMAPEQWEDAHSADARTDLYALGATLYFLLTGRPPFMSDKCRTVASKMRAHLLEDVPELRQLRPDVPDDVAAIYRKLMAKSPADRFQTAEDVAAAVAPFASSRAVAADESRQATTARTVQKTMQVSASAPTQRQIFRDPQPSAGRPSSSSASGGGRFTARQRTLAAGGAGGLLLLGVIIISITSRDGTTSTIVVPEGTNVQVQAAPDTKVSITESSGDAAELARQRRLDNAKTAPSTPAGGERLADRLRAQAGTPNGRPQTALSSSSLVSEPAPRKGLDAWSLESRQHRGGVIVCRPSPDGALLATGGRDAMIRVWNAADGKLQRILCGHECPVQSLDWSSDGSVLLSAAGAEICLWDAAQGQLIRQTTIAEIPRARLSQCVACFGPLDTDVLVLNSRLRYFDTATLTQYRVLDDDFGMYASNAHGRLAGSRKAMRAVTAIPGGPVKLWNTVTGELVHHWTTEGNVVAVALSGDGAVVAASLEGGRIQAWDARSAAPLSLESPLQVGRTAWTVTLSPDGQKLAALAEHDANVTLFDLTSGKSLPALSTPHGQCRCVAWSENGLILSTCGELSEKPIAIWDGPTGRPKQAIGGGQIRSVSGLAWNPKTDELSIGLSSTDARSNGFVLCSLSEPESRSTFYAEAPNSDLSWSSDGEWLIGLQGVVWSRSSQKIIRLPDLSASWFEQQSRAWSSDGQRMALAVPHDNAWTVQIRRLPDFTIEHEVQGFDYVSAVEFSPAGDELVVVGREPGKPNWLKVYRRADLELVRETSLADWEDPRNVRWPAGSSVASLGVAWGLSIWDLSTLKSTGFCHYDQDGAGGGHNAVWMDSRHVASPVAMGMVRVWDMERRNPDESHLNVATLRVPNFYGLVVAAAPDGKRLATTGVWPGSANRVTIWDWPAQKRIGEILVDGDAGQPRLTWISASGEVRSLSGETAPHGLVAVVETAEGQQTMPASELEQFHSR